MNGDSYFLDTNIFLRTIVQDDPVKARDCEELLKAIRDGVITANSSMLVLAEVVWMCLGDYALPKKEVVAFVRGIVSIPNLKFSDQSSPLIAIDLFEKHSVKFIDAAIASHPLFQETHAAIISYDKDFDRLDIPRIEPRDVLKKIREKI